MTPLTVTLGHISHCLQPGQSADFITIVLSAENKGVTAFNTFIVYSSLIIFCYLVLWL